MVHISVLQTTPHNLALCFTYIVCFVFGGFVTIRLPFVITSALIRFHTFDGVRIHVCAVNTRSLERTFLGALTYWNLCTFSGRIQHPSKASTTRQIGVQTRVQSKMEHRSCVVLLSSNLSRNFPFDQSCAVFGLVIAYSTMDNPPRNY